MLKQIRLKSTIKRLPVIGPFARVVWSAIHPPKKFPGSGSYWEERYRAGGTSGAGSYNRLAAFKAETINFFVEKHGIDSVIEFGCGDGSQLKLARYKSYLGFDVSKRAVEECRKKFADDKTKAFKHTDDYLGESADLAMSLDVIYHLIEDSVFDLYMGRLFQSAHRAIVIYSSNDEAWNLRCGGHHVKHRKFSDWVEQNAHGWELLETVPNKYPYLESDIDNTSFADFFFYVKRR